MPQRSRHFYEFGVFRLDPDRHRLFRDGQPVHLSPKSVEALLVLVKNAGKLMEREALIQAVWANAFVEDANLTVAISNLRKALGQNGETAEYIETIPRVGYRFVAEVHEKYDEPRALIIEKRTVSRTVTEEEEFPQADSAIAPASSVYPQTSATLRRFRIGLAVVFASGLVVAAVALGAFLLRNNREPAVTPSINSIAVLPLTSVTEDSDDKALGFGFADALITSLGKLNQVRVISTRTIRRKADLQKEPAEIGKDLGVDSVLDGTFQHLSGKLRVTLRLIRTGDGTQLWSKSFDENESEIFRLQDMMAMQTAQALSLRLRPKETKRPTENREAYQAYLRGRFFFDKRNDEAYDKAMAEFERAIALDSNYALAYTGLADVYALQANGVDGEKRDALYEKSRNTATKALALDESLAEGHTTLGWIKRIHDWDWAGSEREFKRALELDPNYVNAHQWYALLLTTLGRKDEALAEMERARELEPLSKIVLLNLLAVRQYHHEGEQLPLVEQINSLDDSSSDDDQRVAGVYFRTGNDAKVIEYGEHHIAGQGDKPTPIYLAAMLAIAYGRTGQETRARAMLDYLERQAVRSGNASYRLAQAYAALGRKDKAIALLQTRFAARDDRMVWLKVEPNFDSLRDDARFQDLLRKMNLS